MKVKLLFTLFLMACQFTFSQTENLLKGVVSSDNFLLYRVDVINKTSKKSTKTNDEGEFEIAVKPNDSLFFYNKEYHLKRLKVTQEQIERNNLKIIMIQKPEELEEIVVNQMKSIKLSKDKNHEKGKLDDIDVAKRGGKLRTGVYDGSIENGMTKIYRLFGKDAKPNEIEFAVLAKNTCDQKFYLETLKLKPDEIDLFLQFCDTDPKSKALIKNHNVLSMMDFLTVKNKEFKKLSTLK
jgi:hypothetical protein